MNTSEILLQQVQENPDCQALACATRDALEEECGFSSTRAMVRVWVEQELAIAARTLAEATHLMRDGTDSGMILRTFIQRWFGGHWLASTTIVVIAGNSNPEVKGYGRGPRWRAHRPPCVTVGAQWLIHWWKEYQNGTPEYLYPHRPRRRRRG